MPTISRFYGIVIRMYYDDHNPPHFHAFYGDDSAVISIEDNSVLAGDLPARALGLVSEWARQRRTELQEDWRRARERRELYPVEPLQ